MGEKDKRWWSYPDNEAHDALRQASEEVLAAERSRIQLHLEILRVYRNRRGSLAQSEKVGGRTSRNTLRSVVRTIHSRLVGMRPIPFYCSDGGDIELRERLEHLNTAISGLFLSTGVEDRYASIWCLHGILFGAGFLKVYAGEGGVEVERVYPWEILVDPLDGLYGEPQSLYQLRWVDRPVLMDLFPSRKTRELISRASGERPEWAYWLNGLSDPVRVVEGWHLPDSKGKGGRHVLAISSCSLVDEEYRHSDFPVVPFFYTDSEDGYWPDGVGQSLLDRQVEINTISRAIRETIRRCGWPRIYVPQGSQVTPSQLSNVPGEIIEFVGSPPVTVPAPPLTQEATRYLGGLVDSCYEDEGVSQFAARSEKPAGIQSGRALRIYADQQDGRLRDVGQQWTVARTRLGAALIRAQREYSERNPDAQVVFTSLKERTTISVRWRDVDVPDEKLKLVAQPVSSLPQTPAAKAALLEELYNSGSGVITLEEYRDGIDLPDVKALTSAAQAPRRAIEKILDDIVATGLYTPPEAFFDLGIARQLGLYRYCQELTNGTPDPILALLRRWCLDCRDMQIRMMAEEAAAQQPPPPATPTTPAPPPADMMSPEELGVVA